MLTLVREAIREQLEQMTALAELHATGDVRLLDQVAAWLSDTERRLQQLRRPEAAAIAAVRSRYIAGREGHRDAEVNVELSPRKALRAMAALALNRAEQLLRDSLSSIELRLQPLHAQMVQLVSGAQLLGLLSGEPDVCHESWLRGLWQRMGSHEKTRGMHTYLSAALPLVDRLYLLDEVVGNLHSQPEPRLDQGLVS